MTRPLDTLTSTLAVSLRVELIQKERFAWESANIPSVVVDTSCVRRNSVLYSVSHFYLYNNNFEPITRKKVAFGTSIRYRKIGQKRMMNCGIRKIVRQTKYSHNNTASIRTADVSDLRPPLHSYNSSSYCRFYNKI